MIFQIIADENSDEPKCTNNATVIVKLIDRNDVVPKFTKGVYEKLISPDMSVGDVIAEPRVCMTGDVTHVPLKEKLIGSPC